MEIAQLCRITQRTLNDYFDQVQAALVEGRILTTVQNPVPSFPQSIVVTTTPYHHAIELIGARTTYKSLKLFKRELRDEDEFLGQFKYPTDMQPMMSISGNSNLSSLAIVSPRARQELERRFPGIISLFPSQFSFQGDTFGPTIRVAPTANNFRIENTLLANSLDSMVRIRHIRFALLMTRETTPDEYQAALEEYFTVGAGSPITGFTMLPRGEAEIIHRAGQFANLFLMNKLHETSIGSFIDQHRDIMLNALDASDLISEPTLTWQVPPPDPDETAINPDLFVQRSDGYWDVYDLKLALLDRRDITTGGSRRRRFVYTVEDGIAQLAHYKDFIGVPENALHAEEKYGVRFQEPRFTLIVGNYENIDAEKIRQAKLRLGDFEILDYDSLLQLYLVKTDAASTATAPPSAAVQPT